MPLSRGAAHQGGREEERFRIPPGQPLHEPGEMDVHVREKAGIRRHIRDRFSCHCPLSISAGVFGTVRMFLNQGKAVRPWIAAVGKINRPGIRPQGLPKATTRGKLTFSSPHPIILSGKIRGGKVPKASPGSVVFQEMGGWKKRPFSWRGCSASGISGAGPLDALCGRRLRRPLADSSPAVTVPPPLFLTGE